MLGVLNNVPAPVMTASAQRKSPVQAPRPSRHALQNPPPWARGRSVRRSISALIGPGGHATDQPRTKPLISVAVAMSLPALDHIFLLVGRDSVEPRAWTVIRWLDSVSRDQRSDAICSGTSRSAAAALPYMPHFDFASS